MPRAGELTYFSQIGLAGQLHALAKPFSDEDSGLYLQRVGALFNILPPPPLRILDCGCGTGWLAYFLAKRGYEVVATDVAPEAIRLARSNPTFCEGPVPEFVVADTEKLEFDAAFDVVIFFDSLHHSIDESAALQCAYKALRPGGFCVALEPGWGHNRSSAEVEGTFDVTEKDMPPSYIRKLGFRAGFTSCRILPSPHHLGKALFAINRARKSWLRKLLGMTLFKSLAVIGLMALKRWHCGITILYKD
jgi:SAM-dependent methyltransferase